VYINQSERPTAGWSGSAALDLLVLCAVPALTLLQWLIQQVLPQVLLY
jgi:hypothetical protein